MSYLKEQTRGGERLADIAQVQLHRFGHALRQSANDPISCEISKRVIEIRAAWQWIGAAHHNGHDACTDCGFNHPYQGAPGEWLSECRCGCNGEAPDRCPAYSAYLESEREDQALTDELEGASK